MLFLSADTPMFKMHQELGAALMNLLGVDKVRDVHIPTGTPHIISKYLSLRALCCGCTSIDIQHVQADNI